jgi:hypothetical protein
MKKTAWAVLALVGLLFLVPSFVSADQNDDLQAIKKAVKENPSYEAGKDVKWFKVLVTDTKSNKEKVRITLPIAIVEAFVKCADDKHLRIDHDHCDLDIRELLSELKKVGPMALVEIYEDDEIVKVWLE